MPATVCPAPTRSRSLASTGSDAGAAASASRPCAATFPASSRASSHGCSPGIALKSAAVHAAHALHDGDIGTTVFNLVDERVRAALEALPPVTSALPTLSPQALINLVPLLAGLPPPVLGELAAQARSVTFLPADRIIEEGDRGDALYVITQGRVRVSRVARSSEAVAELGEGDFFGEAALLGDQVRTATVEALGNATLLRLSRRDVMALAERSPEVEVRLREANAARQQTSEI